jgi:hypothetical protein
MAEAGRQRGGQEDGEAFAVIEHDHWHARMRRQERSRPVRSLRTINTGRSWRFEGVGQQWPRRRGRNTPAPRATAAPVGVAYGRRHRAGCIDRRPGRANATEEG